MTASNNNIVSWDVCFFFKAIISISFQGLEKEITHTVKSLVLIYSVSDRERLRLCVCVRVSVLSLDNLLIMSLSLLAASRSPSVHPPFKWFFPASCLECQSGYVAKFVRCGGNNQSTTAGSGFPLLQW